MRVQIQRNGVDISDTVLLEGFVMTREFGGAVSTLSMSIIAASTDPEPVEFWDEIEVYEATLIEGTTEDPLFGQALFGQVLFGGVAENQTITGAKQFGGYVTKITRARFRGGSSPMIRYNITVQDYTMLLDRTVIPTGTYSATADNTIITNLFSTYLPAIATTGVSFVSNISMDVTAMSLRALLERITQQSQAHHYITPDKVLHYHDPSSQAAEFSLSESPDNITSFPFIAEEFRFDSDFTTPCNKCTVKGKLTSGTTAISQTYEDAASQATYGVLETTVVDTRIASNAEALARATAEVQQFANPRNTGSIAFRRDGLSLGKLLTIYAPSLGCNGSFRVTRITATWLSKTETKYVAEFGTFRPDLVKTLRTLAEMAAEKADTPIAVPSDGSVGDSKFDRTTDPIQIGPDDISSINAGSITGPITADQIGSVNASTITGLISAGQIESVTATQITGSIQAGQISSITAGQITGVIVTSQLQDEILNTLAKFAAPIAPIERVADKDAIALPDTDYPVGVVILDISESKLYKNVANVWTEVAAKDNITGLLTATDIVSINAAQIVGLIIASQIQSIDATQITGQITAAQIQSIAATQITGTITASQISSVNASAISGLIYSNQIASVNASAISGSISASQIASVNATAITGTINSSQIGSVSAVTITGTITGAQIANLTITGGHIADSTITSAKIDSLAVDKITAWSGANIAIGSGGLTFTGTAGITMSGGGNISVSPGYIAGTSINAGTGGFTTGGGSYSFSFAGVASIASLRVGGNTVIDASRNADFASLKIGGSTVINSSRVGNFNSLQVSGSTVIDSSWNISGASVSVSGSYTSSAPQTSYQLLLNGGGYITLWIRGGIISAIT